MPKVAKKPSTAESRAEAAQDRLLSFLAPYFNQVRWDRRESAKFMENIFDIWWDRWPLFLRKFFDNEEMEMVRRLCNEEINRRVRWIAAMSAGMPLEGEWQDHVSLEADRQRRRDEAAHLATLRRPRPRPIMPPRSTKPSVTPTIPTDKTTNNTTDNTTNETVPEGNPGIAATRDTEERLLSSHFISFDTFLTSAMRDVTNLV
ncbi:hypothetical protein H0H92_006476 [Tricholoma furcatifolium]|nr:hypothetical protein H0H92_006476 [Tricholoma furcatifolium]